MAQLTEFDFQFYTVSDDVGHFGFVVAFVVQITELTDMLSLFKDTRLSCVIL